MSIRDHETWAKILQEALTEGSFNASRPVPGAMLRQIFVKRATEVGLAFPPPDRPEIKFGQFLKEFSDVALISRRRGQDILVVPPNRAELLVETTSAKPHSHSSSRVVIRKDFFDAFTSVASDLNAWYFPADDKIDWKREANAETPTGAIQIPIATMDQAFDDRYQFVKSIEHDQEKSDALKNSLSFNERSSGALTDFGLQIKALGLATKWHEYRVKLVVSRMAEWARANALEWRDSWLDGSEGGEQWKTTKSAGLADGGHWQSYLTDAIGLLSPEDMRRISVPLDVVVNILKRKLGN